MKFSLLGGLTPGKFLARHWQKRPLFVRDALPRFADALKTHDLFALARRDDVESRIVERRGTRWDTAHGPFRRVAPKARNWTVLVSGVNLHVDAAEALLRRFSFLPQARLDDVMVSYATPGGGVGPHVDSYDVFLLQGAGKRRWRIAGKEYVVGSGDLIYLPPGIKHDGVALEPCLTYSIGFRAPRGAELGAAFLDWLHERGLPDARYRDPGAAPVRRPALIPSSMVQFAASILARISWTRGDVVQFLGEYLTQPKPHVVFKASGGRGSLLRLEPRSQLLYAGPHFFLNGDTVHVPARARAAMREFADRRAIEARRLAGLGKLIGEWRRAGYVRLDNG